MNIWISRRLWPYSYLESILFRFMEAQRTASFLATGEPLPLCPHTLPPTRICHSSIQRIDKSKDNLHLAEWWPTLHRLIIKHLQVTNYLESVHILVQANTIYQYSVQNTTKNVQYQSALEGGTQLRPPWLYAASSTARISTQSLELPVNAYRACFNENYSDIAKRTRLPWNMIILL